MALTYIQNGLTEEFATYLTETGLINADNALRGMANGAGILHWIAQLSSNEFEESGEKMLEIFLTKFRELKSKGEVDIKEIIALIWKPDYEGATPLHWAAQSNNSKVVKLLLRDEMSSLLHTQSDDMIIENHSVAVNYLDDKSETPLFYACLEGHLDCVKLLVEEGADMNLSSKMNGFTPLHTAAINSHKGVVTYLIEKGANQSLKDTRGNTALDLAKELEDNELIDYFDPVQRAKIERIRELEKQCEDYKKYIEKLETTKIEFEEKMNKFDSILKEKDDAISGLNQTIESLNSSIQNAKEENNVLYENNTKILSEKNSALDEIRGLILEREKDFLEKQSLLHQIVTLEQTVENKDSEIRNLNETKLEPVDRHEIPFINNSIISDTKMELSDNVKKDLEQGLYRQIRESLNNFNMFNQITVASISDTIRQLDLVLGNKQ